MHHMSTEQSRPERTLTFATPDVVLEIPGKLSALHPATCFPGHDVSNVRLHDPAHVSSVDLCAHATIRAPRTALAIFKVASTMQLVAWEILIDVDACSIISTFVCNRIQDRSHGSQYAFHTMI